MLGIKIDHDIAIPAIIADKATAPIPVRAPFLNVIIRAKTTIITNQRPRTTLTNATNPHTKIFGINPKNETTILIITRGREYPIALITWFNDSASPLIAFPI